MPGNWRKSRAYKAFLKERSYWRKIRQMSRRRDSSSEDDVKVQPAEASSSKASTSAEPSNGASVSLRWDNRPQNEFGHVSASESSDEEDALAIHEKLMDVMDRSDSNDSNTDEMIDILDKLDRAQCKRRSDSNDQSGTEAGTDSIQLGQDEFGGELQQVKVIVMENVDSCCIPFRG